MKYIEQKRAHNRALRDTTINNGPVTTFTPDFDALVPACLSNS